MRSRGYAFVFPAAILLLALTGQSVLGFSLTGARRGSSEEQEFNTLGFEITVQTDRVRRTEQNELEELLEFLNNTTFSQRYEFGAGRELRGTFNIRRNTPCKPEKICFTEVGGVGAFFDLTFRSRGRDPIISSRSSSNFHWIQWVSADYSSVAQNYEFIDIYFPPPGDVNNLVDPNTFPFHSTPYYSSRGTRIIPDRNRRGNQLLNFRDQPYHPNFAYNHDWDFQLYLAEENIRTDATGNIVREVTVYNGISWGWTNTRTPLSSDGGGNGGGNGGGGGIGSGGSGGGGIASSFSAREVPLFDNDSEEGAPDVEKIEKVPEATSLFGLFALSGLGIFQWLKNRKDK